MIRSILVLLPLSGAQRKALEAGAPRADFTYETHESVTDGQIADAEAIVGNLPPSRLGSARSLRLLQLNSAGYDRYARPGIVPKGALLCSARGAYGQAVSEHVFASVLCVMKRLPSYRDLQRAHEWGDLGTVGSPSGASVLVLGAGDIGTHLATLFRAVGARVTGVRTRRTEPTEPFEAMGTLDDLDALLPEADIVCSVLPSTPATRGIAGQRFFSSMREGAVFANAGRGDLVDQAALAAALASGHLSGATIDVATPEPLPKDDPLWDAPNLLLTPHISGFFHLPVTLDNIVAIAAGNISRLDAGNPLTNVVEPLGR